MRADKKIEADKKAEGENKTSETGKVNYGGLNPTSGATGTVKTDMKQKDAAEAAWNEVMSQIPAEVLGG